jgi:D-sedoheptulose 7-phosphate isomerase
MAPINHSCISPSRNLSVADYSIVLHRALANVSAQSVDDAFLLLSEARSAGRTIYVAGNGGSASTASHMGCDMAKNTLNKSDRPLKVISLTDNVAFLTALANDQGYEDSFSGQLAPLVERDDVLIAVSASGNSPNVVKAAIVARKAGAKIVSFTGFDGGRLFLLADAKVHVPVRDYGIAEDAHLIINHVLVMRLKAVGPGFRASPVDRIIASR